MGREGTGVEIRDGSIRLKFVADGQTHRVTLKLEGRTLPPTQANVRYAERLARDVKAAIRVGTFSLAEFFPAEGGEAGLTVSTQLDDWLAAQRIEASTRAGYESAARFWKKTIGTVPLKALRPSQVMRVVAARPELSGKTINNYTDVLREALDLAVLDGLLVKNVVSEVKRAKRQKPTADPFDRAEVEKILALVRDRYPGQVANMTEFWMFTGMRTSEIFALRWDNVDLASSTVLVSEAKVRGELKGTKTNVERTVRLNTRALAAIQGQRAHTQMLGGAVFMDPRYEQPWSDERAFRRSYWAPTLKALQMRYRRPYTMRHSYATAMLMAGMAPAFCAKQLGHSVEMFLTTYSKWLDTDQSDREMQRLEATLQNTKVPGKSPELGSGT